MSANMFGYASSAVVHRPPRVGAQQGADVRRRARACRSSTSPAPAPTSRCCPANARLQTGTPPLGTPEYFVSTEQFLNALIDLQVPRRLGQGLDLDVHRARHAARAELLAERDAGQRVDACQRGRRARDPRDGAGPVLEPRRRRVALGDHTVSATSAPRTRTATRTGGNASVRWYQANVTGGTVAANVVQGGTFDPDGANTFFRFMPSARGRPRRRHGDRLHEVELDHEPADQVRGPARGRPGQHARPDRADADRRHRRAERQLRRRGLHPLGRLQRHGARPERLRRSG